MIKFTRTSSIHYIIFTTVNTLLTSFEERHFNFLLFFGNDEISI